VEQKVIVMQGEIGVSVYSPDGAYIAVAADRRISALSATDYKVYLVYVFLFCLSLDHRGF
jgi:hypothetical protein